MADHHSYSSIEDNVMKLNKQKKAGLMLIGIGLLLITYSVNYGQGKQQRLRVRSNE